MILGPSSSSASTAIYGGGSASDPHIQERVLKGMHLESEKQRGRLMELRLQIQRER